MASQTITINYTPEKRLSLIDAASKTPLYHVKVSRQVPQMELIRLSPGPSDLRGSDGSFPEDEEAYFESRVYTAQFKISSLNVQLRIRQNRDVELTRKAILSTSYSFTSPALVAADIANTMAPSVLTWEADNTNDTLGNFRLVVEAKSELDRKVLVRFRNEAFSNERVGTFEIVDSRLDQLVKDEAVISGLAMLSMVQSMNLGAMVMFGRS